MAFERRLEAPLSPSQSQDSEFRAEFEERLAAGGADDIPDSEDEDPYRDEEDPYINQRASSSADMVPFDELDHSRIVYIAPISGKCFHLEGCKQLRLNSSRIQAVSLCTALHRRYRACKHCRPL